jgi:DNA-binding MarR family transcriptional regulator
MLRLARSEASLEGISVPQLLVVRALSVAGTVPVTQLANLTGALPSTISGILDGLVEARLLRREHGVDDRRQVLISLTAEGRKLARRLEARRGDRWAPVEGRMRQVDAATAVRMLTDVASGLDPPRVDELVRTAGRFAIDAAPYAGPREARRFAT